jgi:hypothetical protein
LSLGERVLGEHFSDQLERRNPKPTLASSNVQPMEGRESLEDTSMMGALGAVGEKPISKPPATLGSICDATQQLMGDAWYSSPQAPIRRPQSQPN